jgi:hypothetical protein
LLDSIDSSWTVSRLVALAFSLWEFQYAAAKGLKYDDWIYEGEIYGKEVLFWNLYPAIHNAVFCRYHIGMGG